MTFNKIEARLSDITMYILIVDDCFSFEIFSLAKNNTSDCLPGKKAINGQSTAKKRTIASLPESSSGGGFAVKLWTLKQDEAWPASV